MKHTLTQLVLALVLALALTPPKALASVSIQGGTVEAVQALVGRILPTAGDADKFQLSITPSTSGKESFSLQCDGSTVSINATGGIALATGVNWYLNHYAGIDISWNSPTAQLPAQLPACALETHEAKVDMRYYLNFCTHSYTMSFWGWDRWQQELDWMALRGINAPLLTVGFEAVYRELLMNHYGLTLAQVSQFVAGPAFYGWFYMDNLTGHGGPVTENWYNDRQQLGTQIFQRAHELGMEPVVPGCLGMVPQGFISNSMAKKNVTGWTTTNIAASGSWQGFTRPALVVGETQMKEYAAAYYQAIETVFDGQCQTRFYALDPFHEGGNTTAATNVCGSVLNFNKYLLQALQTYKADAIWVAQHWQSNPTTDLTRAVPAGKLIILNLHSDRWGESDCSGQNSDASGQKHMWVYGMLNNYGGNVGLFSCMGKMISSLNAALLKKNATNMVGLGAIPEGTENNETSYDVLYSSAWATGSYTLESWTQQWVKQRYGLQPGTDSFETMNRAWLRLMKGPLSCTSNQQQGTTESVFMMRPGNQPGTVSSWAYSSWYWDLDEVKAAAVEFIDLADELGENTNYQYDLVDLVRQCLADEGYRRLSTYSSLSGQAKTTFQQEFLQMILDQDALLGTHPMFRLGRWIEMARALGHTDDEKRLMEENARLQVTTWIKANNALHDYGNREWNGLLASYYYPRWKAYFDGGDSNPGWYANYEVPFWQADTSKPWYQKLPQGAKSAYGTFTAQAEGQPVEVARQMMQKYFSGFQVNYFEPFTPLTGSKYQLRNVNAWKFAAGTEGITVAPPNNDYSAGYRLQRKQLVETDNHFEWQFEPGSAEGTYKMKNVGVAADATNSHYGAYLTTNVSSSGYQALTLSTADNAADWRIFTKGEGDEQQWYIVSADGGTFFAPDVQWNEACVLKGTSRTQNSMLRLVRVQHEGCVDLHYTVADAQGHTVYQTTFYDQTVGEAYPQLTMADGQGYTSSTYYTLTGMPTTNITAEGTQVALSIAYTSQMPFEPSPSFEEGKWYNMTIGTADASKTRQLNYRPGDEVMTLTRTTTQGCDPQDMWCFVGNPFEGYQVYNRLAGATRLLSGPLQNANNQTAALLAQPLPDGYNSRWFIQPSTNGGTNGFYLGQQGHANNRVNVNYTESF